MSGGIDSLAAAYLLKEQGYPIVGIHFRTGYEQSEYLSAYENQLFHLAQQLDIGIQIVDCSKDFNALVINYFVQTYQSGKTPNPCLVCNADIKFGTLRTIAKQFGATALATGHYARVFQTQDGKFHLLKGIDPVKDQSYFLARLNQHHLKDAMFPLGNYTKSQIRQFMKEKHLTPVVKQESQDICFIKGMTYGEFLLKRLGFKSEPGLIETVDGMIIGEHNGLHQFTIGQRRGINCPAAEPYYVIRLDCQRNRLIVGFKKYLYSSQCTVENINWIHSIPESPFIAETRVRYRHQAVRSEVHLVDHQTATVKFYSPEPAVTPGQAAVFYKEEEVIGGGWIQSARSLSL